MMELVTGGSGSGKSAYAEDAVCRLHRNLCRENGERVPLYYIADMIPYGRETEEKIADHRRMRAGKGFRTLEWYLDLEGKLTAEDAPPMENACVLLECLSNLAANEMYMDGGAGENTAQTVARGITLLKKKCRHLVVVTNDVFAESEPDSPEMAVYKQNLAQINRRLAKEADRVTEAVYGIPVCLKGNAADTEEAEDTGKAQQREKGRTSMKLITGGAYQGKLEYAKKMYPDAEWTDGAECPLQAAAECGALYHFQAFVRRWLKAVREKEELIDLILEKNREIIIVCDEIGCGLVPVDAFEREYREAVGRILSALAGEAERVDRVVCGIGTRIK